MTVHIKGGKSLSGEVRIVPNKNAILPAIAASILTDEEMSYNEIPESPDVQKMLQALEQMGATVEKDTATVKICCKYIKTHEVPRKFIYDMQAGYLFIGPLLARFGKATIPIASGCQLGYRGPEEHLEYLRQLGVSCEIKDDMLHFKMEDEIKEERLVVIEEDFERKRSVIYETPNVTPTENILMLFAKT